MLTSRSLHINELQLSTPRLRVETIVPHSQERVSNRDLIVVFADLNTPQPEEAVFHLTFMRWPRQVCDAANDCRLLLHREMIDLVQRNLNANFGLLSRLAGARSLGEMVELQAAHFSNQLAASIGQSEELASLSIKTALHFVRSAYPTWVVNSTS